MVWRFGNELAAKFVGGAGQLGIAERDFIKERDPVRISTLYTEPY